MTAWTRRRTAPALTTMVAALLVAAALPASAEDTTTTFEITAAGALSVTAPGTAELGSVANDATLTASLGEVTALDERGLLTATYTTSVASTEFTATVDATSVEFGNANVTYTSPATVLGAGVVTCAGTGTPVTLEEQRTAMAATLASGTSSCTWSPDITVTPPLEAVVGSYSGTITHSVA